MMMMMMMMMMMLAFRDPIQYESAQLPVHSLCFCGSVATLVACHANMGRQIVNQD